MTEIDPNKVKELREKTGAGMMDCKRALAEAGGDMEKAADQLRQKGLAAASKRSARAAAEGLVAVAHNEECAVVVEVNSETDFVARNENFQKFVKEVAHLALKTPVKFDLESLKKTQYPTAKHTVGDELTNLIAKIGENMSIRRLAGLAIPKDKGVITSYVHNEVLPNIGKIGVLVALESKGDKKKLTEAGRALAMHIAAMKPEAVDVAGLDPAAVKREKDIFTEQTKSSGKPPEIIAKMVEGRLRKYYEEVVLLEQSYVKDQDKKVKQVIEELAKELGAPVKIDGFVRFALGEGVEKKQSDFAAEVAASAGVK